ncbi:MAG: hypothetical protein ABW117_17705, partial [Candidatus Sedimenticola sp. 1PA]
MSEKQAEGISFLPELPIGNLTSASLLFKPALKRLRAMGLQSAIRMIIYKCLDMLTVPGDRLLRHPELLKQRTITYPELFNAGVG